VAGGDAAAIGARGGAGIPPLRPPRARLTTGAGALAALGGAGAVAIAGGGSLAGLAVAGTGGALLSLLLALVFRWSPLVPWSLLLAGGGFMATRGHGASVDAWAAVAGALLLVAAELATWSLQDDARVHAERGVVVRRAATVAALSAASLAVGLMLLATASVSSSTSLVVAAAGIAAAVTAVTVVLRLVRRV
jgi:hypothetical protein